VAMGVPSQVLKHHCELEKQRKDVLRLKFSNSLIVWWSTTLL